MKSSLFFDQTFANYEIIAEENDKIFEYENQVERSLVSDKVLLETADDHLYDNALKYTEEEERYGLSLNSRIVIYLRVEDNGPGISDEDKKRIFDRFYRVDKARTRQRVVWFRTIAKQQPLMALLSKPKGNLFNL